MCVYVCVAVAGAGEAGLARVRPSVEDAHAGTGAAAACHREQSARAPAPPAPWTAPASRRCCSAGQEQRQQECAATSAACSACRVLTAAVRAQDPHSAVLGRPTSVPMYTVHSRRLASSAGSRGASPRPYCPTLRRCSGSRGGGGEGWQKPHGTRQLAPDACSDARNAAWLATCHCPPPPPPQPPTAAAPDGVRQNLLVPRRHRGAHHLRHAAHDGGHGGRVGAAAERQQEAAGAGPAWRGGGAGRGGEQRAGWVGESRPGPQVRRDRGAASAGRCLPSLSAPHGPPPRPAAHRRR